MGKKKLSKICCFYSCLTGIFFCLLSVSFVFFGSATLSAAAQPGWEPRISGHPALPPYKIVVDKSRQMLSLFERRSPPKLSRIFFGTTGQAVGDKEVEGDLKTPEGVYFVVHRIDSGLEFRRFGYEAYTLNYPNPVDRLRGKTGHGIWIHGRGEPLVPLQTEGCVAMDNAEMAMLGRLLIPGTPVVMTESFTFSPEADKEQAAIAEELYQKVADWAAAWSAQSATFFDFYNKEAYSIAQREPFSAFQSHKERLWPRLSWVRTTASHIQVLQGPGYWVTWFYQDYQASNLKTRGVRRLYWMRDDGGEFKIVGMEWRPGLSTSSTLVASSLLPPSATSGPAVIPAGWIVADADTPGSYGVLAAAEGRLPPRITPGQIVVASAPANEVPVLSVDEAPAEVVPVPEVEPVTTSATDADAVLLARPSQEAVRLAQEDRLRQSNDQADALLVAANESSIILPPPLPAQGLAGPSQALAQAAPEQQMAVLEPVEPQQELHAAAPPETLEAVAPEIITPGVVAETAVALASPASAVPAVPTDEELASQVIATVQSWRANWERADLEAYMAHYAPRARQGSRRSAEAIKKQKEELWSRLKPASVQLEDMRVSVKGDTAQVVMRQKYMNEQGGGSTGRKTLSLTLRDGAWLITQEDWGALP